MYNVRLKKNTCSLIDQINHLFNFFQFVLVKLFILYFQDYEFHTGKSEYEDVLQCNNSPSTQTARGHQGPAAFLIKASGLEKVEFFPLELKTMFLINAVIKL